MFLWLAADGILVLTRQQPSEAQAKINKGHQRKYFALFLVVNSNSSNSSSLSGSLSVCHSVTSCDIIFLLYIIWNWTCGPKGTPVTSLHKGNMWGTFGEHQYITVFLNHIYSQLENFQPCYQTHQVSFCNVFPLFRYTRNEESSVEWLVRISRPSARSPRAPTRSSCRGGDILNYN